MSNKVLTTNDRSKYRAMMADRDRGDDIYDAVNNAVSSRVVTITSAEILALHTTAKELVPAPGAGLAVIFDHAVAKLNYNSAAYTLDASDDFIVRYTGGATTGNLESTGFLDQTADTVAIMEPSKGGAPAVAVDANTAIELALNTAVADGDSPISVRVFYRTVPTGL